MRQLGDDLPLRVIVAHLGNGASVTAVKGGKSTDTSMGLTPTGGVIMGTRSGDLDPGVLVYLMREMKFDAAMVEDLVDHRSGLLGLSGVGSDTRRLHEASASNPDARLAIEMCWYAVRIQVAGMISALDAVSTLVFAGGDCSHSVHELTRLGATVVVRVAALIHVNTWFVPRPILNAPRCLYH